MSKINNILVSVFTILILMSIAMCTASAQASTTISIASQTVNATGDTVTVPIMANNITNVAAYTISLTYDPKVVVVDSVGAGDLGGVTKVINNVTGVTQMSAFSTTPLSGNVILANIVLRAVGTAGQASPLTLSITTLSDDNGNSIPADVNNGVFSIAAPNVLNISASPNQVTVGTPTDVVFTVTSNGIAVNGATVTLSGVASGSNTTDVNGNTVINVNATGVGSITATASMTGYTDGTTTVSASQTPPPTKLDISANPTQVTVGIPAKVIFTVTSNGSPIKNAMVKLSGMATGSGKTNAKGIVAINVYAKNKGTITATASMTGYTDGTTTVAAIPPPTLSISANPTQVTVGTSTKVTFTVTSNGSSVKNAIVILSGVANGIGKTNANGIVTINVYAKNKGVITATTSMIGYTSGTTTVTAIKPPALSISANPTQVIVDTSTKVTFTVTSNGSSIKNAMVILSGAAYGSGKTNANGIVVINVYAKNKGTIIATASLTGYMSGTTKVSVVSRGHGR